MQGTYVESHGKEISVLRWLWQWQQCGYNKCIDEARARGQWRQTSTGEVRSMQQWCHHRGYKGEVKQLGKGTHQQSTQSEQKGCNGGTALK